MEEEEGDGEAKGEKKKKMQKGNERRQKDIFTKKVDFIYINSLPVTISDVFSKTEG